MDYSQAFGTKRAHLLWSIYSKVEGVMKLKFVYSAPLEINRFYMIFVLSDVKYFGIQLKFKAWTKKYSCDTTYVHI